MKRTIQLLSTGILAICMTGLSGSQFVEELGAARDDIGNLPQANPCPEYKDLSAALGFTKLGEPISHHSYISSDGTRLNTTYFYYRSPKRANKELLRKLTSAIKIVEQGDRLNNKGQKTGLRFVGIFRSKISPIDEYRLLWTDGSDLGIVYAPSLQHVLVFERPNCP